MALVRPYHALRYNIARYPDLSSVLAPPYDVINAEEQRALYARDEHNVIRLEYGVTADNDTEQDNRYTRAAADLAHWRADNTLLLEEEAAFYPLRQNFSWDGQQYTREGFFAAVELQPFDNGDVLPHEWTLRGPKEDRLRLMHQCRCSFSPVFGLYDGQQSDIARLLQQAMAEQPLGVAHGGQFDETLWRITQSEITEAISQALRQKQIMIADGHHRYETMLALRDILREEYPQAPANAAFNYAFMLLVDINDPGLLVLPTHRLLLLSDAMNAAFCRIAGAKFTLEEVKIAQPEEVETILAKHTEKHAFVWYANGKYTLLTSPHTKQNGLPVIDVVALQERIITPLMKLDPEGISGVESNVRYTINPTEAVHKVDNGECAGAIFLNPTPVSDVLTLASNGIRMPQKSTYFYPKVPTGLVMHALDSDITVQE